MRTITPNEQQLAAELRDANDRIAALEELVAKLQADNESLYRQINPDGFGPCWGRSPVPGHGSDVPPSDRGPVPPPPPAPVPRPPTSFVGQFLRDAL